MGVFKGLAVVAVAMGLVGVASQASAAPELITNGNFDQTTLTRSQQFTGSTQVTGWTNATTSGYTGNGYNFLIQSGTADTTGFYSILGNHDYLWGPGNGVGSSNYSNNGLTASSPVGGNYILADADSNFAGAISQTVNNLTVGSNYLLTFYWAAAQFAGNTGATTERWDVTFGGKTQSTPTLNTASMGFDAWRQQTMYFTANATSQVLSFLAVGTPNGQPPTALLDGVSMSLVPEPGTYALVLVGLAGVTGLTLARRKGASRTAA